MIGSSAETFQAVEKYAQNPPDTQKAYFTKIKDQKNFIRNGNIFSDKMEWELESQIHVLQERKGAECLKKENISYTEIPVCVR